MGGCGRPSFGKFRTCCTHCRGAIGPHAHDCENKAASMAAPRHPVPAACAQAVVPVAIATPVRAQPVAVATPVCAHPPPVYVQPVQHGHHGPGVGMAVGAGVGGLAAGIIGGAMLESALERDRVYGGYGGMGLGGSEFVDVRRGPFETDVVDVRRDMWGGTDVIEQRRGMFGTDITEVRTDMFGDREITEVRTDIFGGREVITERVDMFGDVSFTDTYSPGFW